MPKFSVSVSQDIEAPVAKVFSVVRDFHEWQAWSPWLLAEPEAELAVSDDGQVYEWSGNIVGAGMVELQEEEENRLLRQRLVFRKPWKSRASVCFRFSETDDGTSVSWEMNSSLPFFLFWMKPMMTAMVRMDYSRGLAMLKDYVETGDIPSRLEFVGKTPSSGGRYVGIRRRCAINEVGDRMLQDFQRLSEWLAEKDLTPEGAYFAVYHVFNVTRDRVVYTAAAPLEALPNELPEGFVKGEIPPHQSYAIRHVGPYRHLGNAWTAGMMRRRARVFRSHRKIDPYETYDSDTTTVPEEEWVTTVHFPLA